MTIDNTPPPPGYVKCDVTGKIVPEDETVVISGKRVCAEGKQILLERLRSGQLMPGELEKPSVGRRFLGSLVDNIIMGAAGGIIGGVGGLAIGSLSLSATMAASAQSSLQALAGVMALVYFGAMHASRGQTVGKIACKMKVVKQDGSPIDSGIAFRRSLFYAGPQVIASIGGALAVMAAGMAGAVVIMILSGAVMAYGLANVISALVDSDQQRALHDRLAGTRVIVVHA